MVKKHPEDEISTRTLVKDLIDEKSCDCDFKTDEQRDRWFDAKLFRHYIVLIGLFLVLVSGLFVWGFNKNTVDALQDERQQSQQKSYDEKYAALQKSIEEIKQINKDLFNKVIEMDKKLDGRNNEKIAGRD